MDWFKCYRLVKDGEGYVLEVHLNPHAPEFSRELHGSFKEKVLGLDDSIRQLIRERFSDIRINTVKLLLGTITIASIPFALPVRVKAETVSGSQHAAVAGTVISLNTTGIVTAGSLNVRWGPSTSYGAFHRLWHGNRVKVTGKLGGWYRIQLTDGKTGWVSGSYLRVVDKSQLVNKVIETAKSLVGTPYVWGGESLREGGFDCSGLTQYVFRQAGYSINRVSRDQARNGVHVSRSNIQPGDIILYSIKNNGVIDHVGIYIGNGQMIHSPKPGDRVKITNVGTSYWRTRFITARRIIR